MSRTARFLRTPEGIAGAVLLTVLVLAALAAPYVFPRDPLAIVGPAMVQPFHDAAHPLGTDRLGRDVLAGLFHGARTSLAVGLAAAAASLIFGAIVGTTAGFAGGLVDEALMRVTDAFQTVPGFLLALAFVSVLDRRCQWWLPPLHWAPGPDPRAWRGRKCCRCANAISWPLRERLACALWKSPSGKSCPTPCLRSSLCRL